MYTTYFNTYPFADVITELNDGSYDVGHKFSSKFKSTAYFIDVNFASCCAPVNDVFTVLST